MKSTYDTDMQENQIRKKKIMINIRKNFQIFAWSFCKSIVKGNINCSVIYHNQTQPDINQPANMYGSVGGRMKTKPIHNKNPLNKKTGEP